jgi:hypothetical protein
VICADAQLNEKMKRNNPKNNCIKKADTLLRIGFKIKV